MTETNVRKTGLTNTLWGYIISLQIPVRGIWILEDMEKYRTITRIVYFVLLPE